MNLVSKESRIRLTIIASTFAFGFCLIGVGLVYASLSELRLLDSILRTKQLGRILITGAMVLLAWAFFLLRKYCLHIYAFLELSFGINSIWYALGNKFGGGALGLTLLGSAYILVRGLINLEEAEKQSAQKKLKQRVEDL